MSLPEKLANEIERVTEVLAIYRSIGPAGSIAAGMMNASLKNALSALGSQDPIRMIESIKDLEGFTE